MSGLGECGWWESFYSQCQDEREWYISTDVILKHVLSCVKKPSSECKQAPPSVLHIGCGTSPLSFALHKCGFALENIDFSELATTLMQELAVKRKLDMRFGCQDVRKLSFANKQFDLIVDIGTLDCIVLNPDPIASALAMLSEMQRVLRSGGRALIFSLFGPEKRLRFLCHKSLNWTVQHRALNITPLELPEQKVTHLYTIQAK